jgi:SAM-dependent methyltransferase
MKKDYIPVSEGDSALPEVSFIEDYWTKKWDQRKLTGFLAEYLVKREEYRLMQPYLAKLPKGSRLLDGGCGLGEWTLYLTAQGYHVTGMDLSQATIQKLQDKFPGYPFLSGDIRKTDFGDGTFEAYFSWGTFEHFEDGLGKPLQEAWRILKPGGYLFISVPFQSVRHLLRERKALWDWDEHFDRKHGYTSKMRFYQWRLTRSELQRELEINGFTTLQVTAIHKWQGLKRTLQHDMHFNPRSKSGKTVLHLFTPLIPILAPLVPRFYAAHMIWAVGMKK